MTNNLARIFRMIDVDGSFEVDENEFTMLLVKIGVT